MNTAPYLTDEKTAERVEQTMAAANIAWWEMSLPGGEVLFSPRKTEMLGYQAEDFRHYTDFTRLVHEEDQPKIMQAMHRHLEGRCDQYETEYRIRCAGGCWRWFYDIGSISERDETGAPRKVAGIVMDITEKKEAEARVQRLLKEKDVLLREVHHRIKNNMMTVEMLLQLDADSHTASQECIRLLNEAAGRVHSMQLLYDRLYRNKPGQDLPLNHFLEPLAKSIAANFPQAEGVSLEVDLPEIPLAPEKLQPIGILVNEILTNSFKYALKGTEHPSITISAVQEESAVSLEIRDNGRGLPVGFDPETTEGFGMMLIRAMTEQLQGAVAYSGETGTTVTIRFPL